MSETFFRELFGDSPEVKILDFLISFQMYDYSLTEIAKNSGVSYSSLQVIWPRFVKRGFVRKTRRIGKSDMFSLNRDNLAIRQLIQFEFNLLKQQTMPKLVVSDSKRVYKKK